MPIWRVNALNDWAYEKILILLTNQQQIFLKHKNYFVKLLEHNIIAEESYEDMAERFTTDSAIVSNGVDVHFVTSTSFRRDGRYVIFPELYLIIQNLSNRWNSFATVFGIRDDLFHMLASFCRVSEYNLHTQNFLLESQKINGFYGKMSINFEGNGTVNNLLGLIFEYANYAGIGIKTTLGMGATKITQK